VGTVTRLVGGQTGRLLLVDDSPEIATLVGAYLKGTGFQLDVVDDGEQAVAQATSQKYDVVLMDIDLPGMDGASAAHAIRAADLARGASPTPVVALSAFGAGLPPLEESAAPQSDREAAGAMPDVVRIDDPEIAPLIPEFLSNRRIEVDTIRLLLASGDYHRIQQLGHRMKGSGRGYGFQTISRLGADLEFAAQCQDTSRIEQISGDLEMYLSRVQVETV
jgi:CheY-like chemotaxis protein